MVCTRDQYQYDLHNKAKCTLSKFASFTKLLQEKAQGILQHQVKHQSAMFPYSKEGQQTPELH